MDDKGVLTKDEAERLGREIQEMAGVQAGLDHDFCTLIDRFDAGHGMAWFDGIKSTAHFVAWACSMNAAVAREHVRVARALRQMPHTKDLFAQGRLSYSKVREITRVVGVLDERELCRLAVMMTASQLARTVAGYRTAAGTRVATIHKRAFRVAPTGDGMVRLTLVLPAEDAAKITAAAETAARRTAAEAEPVVAGEDSLDLPAATRWRPVDRLQGIVDVAASFLETLPGEPVDDHTLVLVHVNAEQLSEDVPAGTFSPVEARVPQRQHLAAEGPASTEPSRDVLGTLQSGTCTVEGHGPIEPATAARLICTASVVGAIIDRNGDVLALGRTKRLATRSQRRALRIRDKGRCQFPGCTQMNRLDAHHIVPWSRDGPTDVSNMLLLCRRHHTCVHEGGVRIVRRPESRSWGFVLPDGRSIDGTWLAARPVDSIVGLIGMQARMTPLEERARVFPIGAGAGFSLAECVRVLFDYELDAAPRAA